MVELIQTFYVPTFTHFSTSLALLFQLVLVLHYNFSFFLFRPLLSAEVNIKGFIIIILIIFTMSLYNVLV